MRKAKRLGAFICVMAVVCLALAGRPVAAVSPRVDLDLARGSRMCSVHWRNWAT